VILLDTNVLSVLMQSRRDPMVVSWLDQQVPESIWTTSINVFEIEFGLAIMDEGRRRTDLTRAFGELLREDLAGRVALFDVAAARAAATLAARRQRAGRPVDFRHTEIAGVALARRARIATRNIRHFQDLDPPPIDPWA
jgi:predicted nucleic acid-binding protein